MASRECESATVDISNNSTMAEDQGKIGFDLVDGGLASVGVVSDNKEKVLAQIEEENKAADVKFSRKTRIYIRKFRYYFRHPYFRIFVAYFVTICNFFIYAEDPVAHSYSGCKIPLIGHDYAFVFDRYPKGGYSALKFFLWFIGILVGILIGKVFFHKFVFRKLLKLSMFANCQGSWMVMFFSTLLALFIFGFIYNGFLSIGGSAYNMYKVSSYLGIQNRTFMKVAALGTWMGDFVTAWMVTDMMLQEVKRYPWWAKKARRWWEGWNRIIMFWAVLFILTAVVASSILTDFIQWDKLNRDVAYTNELGRAFLASFILLMDFTIVMQDWDFPKFKSDFDIKLPGLNTAHINFEIPDFFRKEHWEIHISGKWFNYGILFMVMLLDLNMWKNQIFYKPYDYGQYVGPDGKIFSVHDTTFLATANKTVLSYSWRWNHLNPLTNKTFGKEDTKMNSRFRNYSLGLMSIAFIPTFATFLVFGILIWIFGRESTFGSIESLTLDRAKLQRVQFNIDRDGVDNPAAGGDGDNKNSDDKKVENVETKQSAFLIEEVDGHSNEVSGTSVVIGDDELSVNDTERPITLV